MKTALIILILLVCNPVFAMYPENAFFKSEIQHGIYRVSVEDFVKALKPGTWSKSDPYFKNSWVYKINGSRTSISYRFDDKKIMKSSESSPTGSIIESVKSVYIMSNGKLLGPDIIDKSVSDIIFSTTKGKIQTLDYYDNLSGQYIYESQIKPNSKVKNIFTIAYTTPIGPAHAKIDIYFESMLITNNENNSVCRILADDVDMIKNYEYESLEINLSDCDIAVSIDTKNKYNHVNMRYRGDCNKYCNKTIVPAGVDLANFMPTTSGKHMINNKILELDRKSREREKAMKWK